MLSHFLAVLKTSGLDFPLSLRFQAGLSLRGMSGSSVVVCSASETLLGGRGSTENPHPENRMNLLPFREGCRKGLQDRSTSGFPTSQPVLP